MYLLAKEFGDDVTLNKRTNNNESFRWKWFGDENEQFGYFFRLNEKFPRGQQSSLFAFYFLSVSSWCRAFANANDHSRFHAPSVEGVDYPKCGVSKAINDILRIYIENYSYQVQKVNQQVFTLQNKHY